MLEIDGTLRQQCDLPGRQVQWRAARNPGLPLAFWALTDADAWAAIMSEEETESLVGARSQRTRCLPSVDE
jgi:hypothetical protein